MQMWSRGLQLTVLRRAVIVWGEDAAQDDAAPAKGYSRGEEWPYDQSGAH
jgi:hypothetical protein